VLAAARRAMRPGISAEQAVLIGYAEVAGEPIHPSAFDDAAVLLRAECLLDDGVRVEKALRTARAELVTWSLLYEAGL
jgi:hypothetical protein